ncbi:MAG: heme A synthase [Alphaproteobacteria bacterium]|nr:heme A synthase [Alphaproteobacteria bacterium]|tara:strand:- start:887 stop:1987 length:1101 start_codon:yes stop_codon:yes gene_type:complete
MTATTIAGQDSRRTSVRLVAIWLFVCAALVFVMVVVGGLTRLTHSGLSMVDWRPVTGWLPPLDEAAWQGAFEEYRKFPEYQKRNSGMSLGEFKSIFWFEYLHRLLGRVIGLVFFLPFLWFAATRKIGGRLVCWLAFIFCLGGLQGVVGWWMVKSGLVDRPDVSQYRLASHLGLAVIIYGLLIWTALSLVFRGSKDTAPEPKLYLGAICCLVAVFVTMLSGALVAGLDAGFAYNTFPTMNGQWIPEGLMAQSPWYANLTENTVTVQFDHRWLATFTVIGIAVLWWRARKQEIGDLAQRALLGLTVAGLLQLVFGIATVILVVPTPLAATHQAVAMLVFTLAVVTTHALRPDTSGFSKLSSIAGDVER